MLRYPLLILVFVIAISFSLHAHAQGLVRQTGPEWFIQQISPLEATSTKGKEVSFDLLIINLTGLHYKSLEVTFMPTVPGHKGWFTIKACRIRNVQPQESFKARVNITPTYRTPEGVHNFYTSVKVAGYPPSIIKNGPRLRVIRKKEGLPLHAMVPKEILITVQGNKKSLRPLLEQLRRSYRLEVAEITELKSLEKSLVRLQVPAELSIKEVMKVLSRDPYKIASQPNFIYRSCGTKKPDPLSDLQYAFKAMGAEQLPPGVDGRGVKVALIDSGVDYLHQDLKGRIAKKKDVTGDGSFQQDLHGTALAGIIAAQCKNGLGICGLAPEADIVAIKACRPIAENKITATTTTYWLSQGIDYAILQKVRVINLSLGGPKDPLISELVEEAFARGNVIVAAAGDKGLTNYPTYPAALPQVIAVAAVDIKGNPYAEGIKGDFITLCAPGVDIMTTLPEDKYNFCTGTSMAAAYITGAVVLLLQKHPHLKPKEVRSLLEKSAKDCGPPGRDKEFGYGLVDLKRLLEIQNKKTVEPFRKNGDLLGIRRNKATVLITF